MGREEQYQAAQQELLRRTEQERDLIANLSNASAILNEFMDEINWVGFYLYREEQLILGPFQGRPACVRIQIGKGVCGTAFGNNETLVVPDVHEFPGHIACDDRSRSEIVVPIRQGGKATAVLDIDSPVAKRFGELDRRYLEEFVRTLETCCNW